MSRDNRKLTVRVSRLGLGCFALALLGVTSAHGAGSGSLVIDQMQVDKPTEAATRLYTLDSTMQRNYADTQRLIGEKQSPVILAMFNGVGGQYILRRNGQKIAAEPVPALYQQIKSVSHTIVGVYEIIAPYFANSETGNWRPKLTEYNQMLKEALATLGNVGMPPEVEANCRTILQGDIDYTDKILKEGSFSAESFSAYAKSILPAISENVALAGKLQVDHFEALVTKWRKEMGEEEWSRLYAIVATAWAMRRENVHFQILADMMGHDTVNDRLIIAESIPDVTEDQLIMLLGRIINDRGVGILVFGKEFRMDVELMGEGARAAIEQKATPHHHASDVKWMPYEEHKMPNEE